ncbi:HAD domain-containing protein [Hydrogenophaga laconesensis]|jgi:hypothetical protein|uniref:Uncharacterized protein n=1 Tax=Hydrogenophaga laconesensis TaxID=1805971 RepID=A0ABU1V934_9BURK|nr:HAD domain-containing protein [Hydrogenophaga laconesensis]MDR7093945.1 hypothetical protein [Hydrogenophaga laconesensis]
MTSAIRPSKLPGPAATLPRGYGGPLLYLDYDGVLHHHNVLWHPKRGPYDGHPGFQLFEHVALLEQLLDPFPEVQVVLSTAWVRRYGVYATAKRLSPKLRSRVVGATFHSKMDEAEFAAKPRGQQVLEDVMRRKPSKWVALDDVDEGWPLERSHVFITDECFGLGAPAAANSVRAVLQRAFG